MYRLRTVLVFFCLGLFTATAAARPRVDVGFVFDGPSENNTRDLALFKEEMSRLLDPDYDVRYPDTAVRTGTYDAASVARELDSLLNDRTIDVVITMGILSSIDLTRRDRITKPSVAAFMIEPALTGATPRGGASGKRNLSYITATAPFESDLDTFEELVPFTRLALLASEGLVNSLHTTADRVVERIAARGIDATMVPVGTNATEAARRIPDEIEAVYILNVDQLGPGEFDVLIQRLIDRKLPTFSIEGRHHVERGILAGLTSGNWLLRVARRTALNLQAILTGRDASELPVFMNRREELVINDSTARKIGVYASFELLTEATMFSPEPKPVTRTITLSQVMADIVVENRDVIDARLQELSGKQDVNRTRSQLLPRIDLTGSGVIIDDDRASPGIAAERTLSGGLELSQIIWSEQAWANLSIQKHLQKNREWERQRVELDVALSGATTYLQLLRAKTFENIQRENVRLTRSNLELAEMRVAIGTANPAELHRWRSQIANDRKAVIQANADRNVAEIALNQLLHRPVEESFATVEADVSDPALPTHARIHAYAQNPRHFRMFRAFMSEQALKNAPELKALDAAIAAQQRAKTSATASFLSPTLALQAETTRRFDTGGAGAVDIPGGPDDTDWSVALGLSFPIFSGGSRIADLRQANQELLILQNQRDDVAKRIEQRVRSAMHQAGASGAGIGLSEEAAIAAEANLEYVRDAYSRGVVSILQLLDAQNAAITARLAAADAVYDYLIDLLEVERAGGGFTFYATPEEEEAFYDSLDAYFDAQSAP